MPRNKIAYQTPNGSIVLAGLGRFALIMWTIQTVCLLVLAIKL